MSIETHQELIMSEEATFKLTDVMEPGPEEACSKTFEELHPVLYKKLAAVKEREDTGELTSDEGGWEVMKLFVEAGFNPFLASNLALFETA